ncbi:MAG TPA: hypothetical protein VFD03_05475, partial [Clostridia bacterium]|nr:hypothetical protein [Clostridia bacterium]
LLQRTNIRAPYNDGNPSRGVIKLCKQLESDIVILYMQLSIMRKLEGKRKNGRNDYHIVEYEYVYV